MLFAVFDTVLCLEVKTLGHKVDCCDIGCLGALVNAGIHDALQRGDRRTRSFQDHARISGLPSADFWHRRCAGGAWGDNVFSLPGICFREGLYHLIENEKAIDDAEIQSSEEEIASGQVQT